MSKSPFGLGLALSMAVFAACLLAGYIVPAPMFAVVGPLLIAASGACVLILKKRSSRTSTTRSRETERLLLERARDRALRDALIVGTVFIGAAAVFHQLPAAVPFVALVFFLVTDFWVRYAYLCHRPGGGS